MDDRSIWKKIVEGDVNALRQLHDRYYHGLWLWAVKNTRNESLAEELVSDCFIKLWDSRRKISIEKSVKSYLFLMLRNQFISHARKSKHELVFDDNKFPDLPDVTEMNDQDFYAELYKAIQKIPEQRRKILELAVFESQSYKEIALRLGISVNTVKTQMGRSYQFLKEELDPKNFSLLHFFMKKKKQIHV